MTVELAIDSIRQQNLVPGNHQKSRYFDAIKALVEGRNAAENATDRQKWQQAIDQIYDLVKDEILHNTAPPTKAISFGTSGWRGTLGKDLNIRSVALVTAAILGMYQNVRDSEELRSALGVTSFEEMQTRGCVIGFDNRFGGHLLAQAAVNVLRANGVQIYYAGEATTGAISASVLVHKAAFSINLTPSHNPLEYGGFKYNAADGGPAAPILTDTITALARQYVGSDTIPMLPEGLDLLQPVVAETGIVMEDALD
ncbi:MAG: phosphoglucomutase, partial [Desulfobulbus sp.]|nr:phosphoglucomutase [Desulfobulbus sp.]